MTFISYAQNYEDVMLWRALKHVQNGFYIDVGAWSPDIDSVTRLFYENGWTGINIEPNPDFYKLYLNRRPNDINLKLAVGDKEGKLLINFVSNPGLSTAIDQFAIQHEAAGWSINRQDVELTTLRSICKEYVTPAQSIHFLKVDVEGLEELVLRGNDWSANRPWIVVVEATLPMSQVESYDSWEPMLLQANYFFVYADGLNRFYIAEEHLELREAFKYPPNVFDGFKLSSIKEVETKAQQAETKAQQAETKAQQAETKAQQAETKAQQAETKAQQAETKAQQAETKAQQAETKAQQAETKAQQAETKAQQAETKAQQAETKAQQADEALNLYRATLSAMRESKSWKMTAPLRWVLVQSRRLLDEGVKSRAKAFVKKALRKINHELLKRPVLRQRVIRTCRKIGLYKWLRAIREKLQFQDEKLQRELTYKRCDGSNRRALSVKATSVYEDLKKALSTQSESN